ncbi:MAG TPA: hypothetical protein VG457_03695 [Planctomycetota bacterium]|jgi:hypothetical protein|nr:hypothetical protein [Planctomycetota bacterium]
MTHRIALLAALLAMAGGAQAAPRDAKEDLKAAIHKLSQAENYSWIILSTNSGDTADKYGFASGEGRIERGGLTWLRTQESPTVEVLLKGGKTAVRLEDGWALEQELSGAGAVRRHPNLAAVRSLKSRSRPAAEANELLKHVKDPSTGVDGYITSELTPESVKELLHKYLRTSGRAAEVSSPAGSLAFWVREGNLTKYEVRLRGTVTFSAPRPSTWNADQVMTVSLSEVGTSKIDVPGDVKKMVE